MIKGGINQLYQKVTNKSSRSSTVLRSNSTPETEKTGKTYESRVKVTWGTEAATQATPHSWGNKVKTPGPTHAFMGRLSTMHLFKKETADTSQELHDVREGISQSSVDHLKQEKLSASIPSDKQQKNEVKQWIKNNDKEMEELNKDLRSIGNSCNAFKESFKGLEGREVNPQLSTVYKSFHKSIESCNEGKKLFVEIQNDKEEIANLLNKFDRPDNKDKAHDMQLIKAAQGRIKNNMQEVENRGDNLKNQLHKTQNSFIAMHTREIGIAAKDNSTYEKITAYMSANVAKMQSLNDGELEERNISLKRLLYIMYKANKTEGALNKSVNAIERIRTRMDTIFAQIETAPSDEKKLHLFNQVQKEHARLKGIEEEVRARIEKVATLFPPELESLPTEGSLPPQLKQSLPPGIAEAYKFFNISPLSTEQEKNGVEVQNKLNELTKTYRKLSLSWHPDKCKNTGLTAAAMTSRFQAMGEAHTALKDYLEEKLTKASTSGTQTNAETMD